MIDKSEIVQRRQEIAEIRHADGVFRDIQARIKERENYEQRWFWELLQNAKDAVENDETVKARIEITDSQLTFSHTGNPFELDDILSLIIQGSSKGDKEGKDGRFGTGFLTTYLLSKKVEITGILTDNKGCFSFQLNREGETNAIFFENQMLSNNAFDNSIQNDTYLPGTTYQTKFVYALDTAGKSTAEVGLQSMNELIPFTQLFNNKISSVDFVRNGHTTSYRKTFVEDIEINASNIKFYQLETLEDEEKSRCINAYLLKTDVYDICFLTSLENKIEKIIPLDERYPKLYFTFPLIGTEGFGIPLVINSSKFDPKIERDGIYLLSQKKEGDEKTESIFISNNKKILENALTEASVIFAKLVVKKRITGIYELFKYECAKTYSWLDNIWLNELKKAIFLQMAEIPCITGKQIEPVSLDSLWIPFDDNSDFVEKLWTLLQALKEFDIPRFSELHEWISVCRSQALIAEQETKLLDFVYNINDLIHYIESLENLANLTDSLNEQVETWINSFYTFVNEHADIFPLEDKIMVNQQAKFRAAEGMSWDKCGDDELKSISENTGLHFKNFLIAEDVTPFTITGIQEFTVSKAVSNLANFFNTLPDFEYAKIEIQEATARFLKWLIDKQQNDIIKDLKILSGDRKKDDDALVILPFPKGKHLQLSPKNHFNKNYPLYANIIRERDCMHPVYNQYLSQPDYDYLDKNGYIHESPLVIKTEKIDSKTAELLITDVEKFTLLKDDEGKLKENVEITYSDFAYLTASDGHIYDRNATPASSLERFRFLLLEATEKDPLFDDDHIEVNLTDGKMVAFHQCLWLYRAGDNQWVNLKKDEKDTDKKSKEEPNSKNLSALIKHESDLIKAIKGERQQLFLSRLDVGVSDLIRNTLSSDALRLSWDKAITSMIISDADPELVQEIFNDTGIKAEYERRLEERKLIERNQAIGKLVEELFKKAIKKLKDEGVKIDIKREPFGSDYILTEESSDLVNKDRELEVFKINDWLVELKATGREYAAMTLLQAQTAQRIKNNYALVVVPLDGTKPDLAYIEANAKVISDIGYNIDQVLGDYNEVEDRKQKLNNGKAGVSVSIEDQQVRFKVSASLWKNLEDATIEKFVYEKFNA